MKNLMSKFKEGVEKIGKQVILPIAGSALLYPASIQNTNAQSRKFPEKLDHGARFYRSKINSNYSLEEKVFFNVVTGKEERFYINQIEPNKYSNDLDFVSLDFNKTIPRINLKTGKVSELTSKEGMYVYFPEKLSDGELANSIVVKNSHISNWCDEQIRDKTGVKKGINYISISDVKDLFPAQDMLELGNGKEFIVLTVPKELQELGKTNHYLIPVDDKHEVGFNPVTKKIILYGSIYRGFLDKKTVKVETSPFVGSDIGRDNSFEEMNQDKEETKIKQSSTKKGTTHLVFGANANNTFGEGNLGIQYGPIAIIANAGKAKDEITLEGATNPSQVTGRYANIKEWNQNLKSIGVSGELHPFSDKKISPFIGGGINKWNYIQNKSIRLFGRNGQLLDSDSESKAESENSWKTYAGLNFQLKNSKLGVQAGYDTKSKFFGGVRYSIRLGK